jgi:hypothetical protein
MIFAQLCFFATGLRKRTFINLKVNVFVVPNLCDGIVALPLDEWHAVSLASRTAATGRRSLAEKPTRR